MERLSGAFDWWLRGFDDGSWSLIDFGDGAEVGESVRHCEMVLMILEWNMYRYGYVRDFV